MLMFRFGLENSYSLFLHIEVNAKDFLQLNRHKVAIEGVIVNTAVRVRLK